MKDTEKYSIVSCENFSEDEISDDFSLYEAVIMLFTVLYSVIAENFFNIFGVKSRKKS